VTGSRMNNNRILDMHRYLKGQELYGDNFTQQEIIEWFADEENAYSKLWVGYGDSHTYEFHALNTALLFKHLPDVSFESVLGFGSAHGDEFLPIINLIKSLTIVEPSEIFIRDSILNIPVKYIKPRPEGCLPFPDNNFDLVTCLSALHHIPNVSFVLSEISRVIKPNGYLLLREPIESMGDWEKPRKGLTKRERGIPLHILRYILDSCHLQIIKDSYCVFAITPYLFQRIKPDYFNSKLIVLIDRILSHTFRWNTIYHPHNFFQRLRPKCIAFVLKKQ